MKGKNLYSDLNQTQEISVQAYYPEDLNPKLRNSLKTNLEEIYHEKYTPHIPEAETAPILSITKSNHVKLLIGEEICFETVNKALKE